MISCEEALERMSQALDGPLSPTEQQELEEHLFQCPECRTAYQTLQQMEEALQDLGETPAPPELSARVMARIAQETKARSPIPLWKKSRWRNLAGLAACAVLCVGLYYGAGLQETVQNGAAEPQGTVQNVPEEPTPQTRDFSTQPQDETEPSENQEDQPTSAALEPQEENTPATDQEQGETPADASLDARTFQVQTYAPASDTEIPQAEGDHSGAEPLPDGTQNETKTEEPQEISPQGNLETEVDSESPAVAFASASHPWGENTALELSGVVLPEAARALLPDSEAWAQEEDGTWWCFISSEALGQLQAVLTEAGMAVQFPEQPWTDSCAVVLLPEEPSGEETS